jgi:hypothetical protein
VWLGRGERPKEHDYSVQWARTNPEWQLRTWTDENVEQLFPLVSQRLYDTAPTVVHRADLIYVEAVRVFGGAAVGYDMEPLRPLEPLIGERDCWCTPDADGFAGSAFFGATPNHPAIAHVLETINARVARDGWHPTMPNEDTGPWAWGEAFGRFHEDCAVHGMAVLGDWKTAYPVRYWEKEIFDQPVRLKQRTRNSVVVHRFAGSWLNPKLDLRVR